MPSRTAQRRRRPHQSARRPRAVGSLQGRPVYDAHVVGEVRFAEPDGVDAVDSRVVLGIGPVDAPPVAFLQLCPCDGVTGLIQDLASVAATASEFHVPHDA